MFIKIGDKTFNLDHITSTKCLEDDEFSIHFSNTPVPAHFYREQSIIMRLFFSGEFERLYAKSRNVINLDELFNKFNEKEG